MRLTLLTLGPLFASALLAACGSGSGSTDSTPDSGAADLCTKTGGKVVETFCSANPAFAEYTCASADNGEGICDPVPGEGSAGTPECVCPGGTSACFDPVKGCVSAKD
jgi:hypothetical protein